MRVRPYGIVGPPSGFDNAALDAVVEAIWTHEAEAALTTMIQIARILCPNRVTTPTIDQR